jgi:hypothetical protein
MITNKTLAPNALITGMSALHFNILPWRPLYRGRPRPRAVATTTFLALLRNKYVASANNSGSRSAGLLMQAPKRSGLASCGRRRAADFLALYPPCFSSVRRAKKSFLSSSLLANSRNRRLDDCHT